MEPEIRIKEEIDSESDSDSNKVIDYRITSTKFRAVTNDSILKKRSADVNTEPEEQNGFEEAFDPSEFVSSELNIKEEEPDVPETTNLLAHQFKVNELQEGALDLAQNYQKNDPLYNPEPDGTTELPKPKKPRKKITSKREYKLPLGDSSSSPLLMSIANKEDIQRIKKQSGKKAKEGKTEKSLEKQEEDTEG